MIAILHWLQRNGWFFPLILVRLLIAWNVTVGSGPSSQGALLVLQVAISTVILDAVRIGVGAGPQSDVLLSIFREPRRPETLNFKTA